MGLPEKLPTYDELPISPDKPPHSAWGVFGDDDALGTLNLLTPERIAAAAKLVRSGKVFPFNWELELPDPPMFGREKLEHAVLTRRWNVNDDIYTAFNPQSSSQWDGFTHYGHPAHGFYNGVQATDITGKPGTRNGIEQWARHGIAGRAVLVDFERYANEQKLDYKPNITYRISVDELKAAAESQGVTFQAGDILLLRTGWTSWYTSLTPEERADLPTTRESYRWAGMGQGEESLRFLWDTHFAAVASDCPSFEAFTPPTQEEFMHNFILPFFGMPIGGRIYAQFYSAVFWYAYRRNVVSGQVGGGLRSRWSIRMLLYFCPS